MIRYFPIPAGDFRLRMDAVVLADDRLIEVDDAYREEIALKAEILAADRDYYCHAPSDTLPAQREAARLLMETMARHDRRRFAVDVQPGGWTWVNRPLGLQVRVEAGASSWAGVAPLEWIGRQVQEDLLLLRPDGGGRALLAAGVLCFASKWCLDEKIGLPVAEIHGPVPGYTERLASPVDAALARLRPGRPIGRVNWTIAPTDRLNLSPATREVWGAAAERITPENAGVLCHLRVERQTFSRLPDTGAILFTIRTYLNPIDEVIADPDRLARLHGALRTMPAETIEYKGMRTYRDALLRCLSRRSG